MKAREAKPFGDRVRAMWNGAVLAESDRTVIVEGNHYFPLEDVRPEYLADNSEHSFCPWKGTASYYDVVVDGRRNSGVAWYYPDPFLAARAIRGRVAFWRGVSVERLAA